MISQNRREFLRSLGLLSAGAGLSTLTSFSLPDMEASKFKISLAEWSFHKMIKAGELDNLGFPAKAKKDFGIAAVEYVSQFFPDKANDIAYLADLKKRCSDHGVRSVLIMIDQEGDLANTDSDKRKIAVENHYKWVDAAKFLGCHSIRVNCAGKGSMEEVSKAGIEGLTKLSEFAKKSSIGVIVENHGGYSSNGSWLSNIIKTVNLPNCGTLPDFGNFCVVKDNNVCIDMYDRYKGVTEMMPFAKGVSAKSLDFDEKGNCVETDYDKMMPIVFNAGYKGYIGIEYEGDKLSEMDGVRATLKLLQRFGGAVS